MHKRTLREWFAYLDSTERELTESEFMAVMLMNIREYLRVLLGQAGEIGQAAEHVEGMLGALDGLGAEIAARSGLPYAASAPSRAALAAGRNGRLPEAPR